MAAFIGPMPSGHMIDPAPGPSPLSIFGGALGPIQATVSAIMGSAMMGPYNRDRVYAANRTGIRSSPSPDAALAAYWAGMLGEVGSLGARKIRDGVLGEHGIWWAGSKMESATVGTWLDYRSDIWNSWINLSQPWADWKLLREGWLRGFDGSTQADAEIALKRQGIKDPHWLKLMLEMGWTPDINTILVAYFSGRILGLGPRDPVAEHAEVIRLLRAAGVQDSATQTWLLSQSQPTTPAETLALWNRGYIDDVEADRRLSAAGLREQQVRDSFKELRKEIPGPSDLVRFAVREVFTPSLSIRYGFDQEFPESLREWGQKQGLTERFVVTDPVTGQQQQMDWPLAYWIAHWQWPSPDMAYRMRQRFRVDGGPAGGARDPSGLVFTGQDLSALLKGSDYPPHWRPYLEALSYRVMDKRDIRWGVKFGTFAQDEAAERYQDQGYNAQDAGVMSQIDVDRRRWEDEAWKRALDIAARKAAVKCTLDLFDLGGIDQADAETYLATAGLSPAARTRLIYQRITCWQSKILAQGIAAIRSLFLRGEIDRPLALDRLAQAGVQTTMALHYVDLWDIQLTPHRRRLSAAKIQDWVARGFISYADGLLYLSRIGWQNPELILLMAEAGAKQAKLAAAAAAAANKSANQAAAKIKAALKESQAQQRSLLAELRRAEPVGLLKRLAKSGKLTEADYRARLADQQYPQEAIDYYAQDAYA